MTNSDAATRNEIQDLKNNHEKELQIVVGKTKAVLRSNFRKQILEFEKEYDARIAQMKSNLRDELNKKHDDELRRLKDRHVKDIKMMKLEIKKAAAKKREAIRFFIVEKQHQKKSKQNSFLRRSYEPQSLHARSSAQRTNNSNKRLQNKLKEATIGLKN